MQTLTIKPNLSPAFKPLFSDYKECCIIGGRAKGATQACSKFVSSSLIVNPNLRAVIIRNEANKIEESIFLPIKQRLIEIDRKTNGLVTNQFLLQDVAVKNKKTNQNSIFLKGVRASTAEDTDVFKGLEDLDIAVIEEAQQIRSGVAIQKLLDTGIRFENFKLIILANTPDTKDHWIIKKYFELKNACVEGYYQLAPKKLKNTIQIIASYKDNPYLAPEAIEQYESYEKKDPHWFYSQILGLVPKDSGSRSICKRTHKASWRDSDDIEYTLTHPFIEQSQEEEGYYFISFDGGEHTNRKAAVLGYHVDRYNRDILLKEFYNHLDNHDLREVAMQVREYIELKGIKGEIKIYGDPAIFHDGVHSLIEGVFPGKYLNCLEHFRKSTNKMLVEIYQNRKKKRLARLSTDIFNIASDNKPQIIIIKNECKKLYSGFFDGLYRYELNTKNEATDEIEQFKDGEYKHLTDICDAYTYYLLAERPFTMAEKEEKKIDYSKYGSGW
jgi:PBSX family phage terminase large subunit